MQKFTGATLRATGKNTSHCQATILYKQSSLQYSDDPGGKLFKNLGLYQKIFEQSHMDVQKQTLYFSKAKTIKLTIIPRKKKGKVKTINFFQQNRNISLGQSAEQEMKPIMNWLLKKPVQERNAAKK